MRLSDENKILPSTTNSQKSFDSLWQETASVGLPRQDYWSTFNTNDDPSYAEIRCYTGIQLLRPGEFFRPPRISHIGVRSGTGSDGSITDGHYASNNVGRSWKGVCVVHTERGQRAEWISIGMSETNDPPILFVVVGEFHVARWTRWGIALIFIRSWP
jgi:hypothetical protein